MSFDDENINITVLGLFFELNVPPGGRLAYRTLREEWPKYQLRARDLDLGVHRLVGRGDLSLLRDDGQELVALTVQGHQYGGSLSAPVNIAQSIWRSIKVAFWPASRGRGYGVRHRSDQHRSCDRTRITDLD